MTSPLQGEVVVEESEAAIQSIELQLVRVETVNYAEGTAREATEVFFVLPPFSFVFSFIQETKSFFFFFFL